MKLTEEQLTARLNDELNMLLRSADAYDQGHYYEATRLAGSIIKIIGDRRKKSGAPNKNFVSLLTQLGTKPESMVDTSLPELIDQTNLHGPLFILGFHVSGGTGLIPNLDGFPQENYSPPKLTLFEKWWSDPIIRDCTGNEFSRQNIIETMRDQEDAHTDGELDSAYAGISYKGTIGITQVDPNPHIFDTNPARVISRQVAHEILRTLRPQMPPKWIQTRGLKVQPIMLHEVWEEDYNGNYRLVTDHKAIEFKSESTGSYETWREWKKFIAPPMLADASKIVTNSKAKNFRLRIVLLNHTPYPIEDIKTMISMQHPS
ncbi:MAG TPA: hypothetical protein VIZ65_00065 [Cellvibrionaceae bacterium]